MSLEDIRNERIKKLSRLLESGLDPYPASAKRSRQISDVLKSFSKFSGPKAKTIIAGRIMAKREHGGSMFLDLKDYSGKIQVYFKKDILKDSYDNAVGILDIGDFISVTGAGFKTKRDEKTVEVRSWQMLAKSLRTLPEKWEGLKDTEERFRRRYLDLLMDDEVAERFKTRSTIISFLRDELVKNYFLEVETPILQPIPGGAKAQPFVTRHNALGQDFYLRIAPELYLKRLLIGGFEKVFEIGKNFRNEGIDRDHNPEFTMLELYWAYQDQRGLMKFTQTLLQKFIPGKYEEITFAEIFRQHSGKDWTEIDENELDEIFKKEVRPKIKNPTFVTDYPESIMALAKFKKDAPKLTESFQLIMAGIELAKGFSEMNNPLLQREQMEIQEKAFRAGNKEASRLDEDFLEALEYGMPPAAGLGIGIDRLAMLLTSIKNIREIVLFPTLRPK